MANPITQADLNRLPVFPDHLAIIMDGNGRWAKARQRARRVGHRVGGESARTIITACARAERIRQLTLYAFSTENWKRPPDEVRFLMKELKRFIVNERPTVLRNNIRFRAIGRIGELREDIQQEIRKTEELSAGNNGMTLAVGLNYGSRQEIVDACRGIAGEVAAGRLDPKAIGEDTLSTHLYQPGMPDVDLLIRTAGEFRISNYLLWQISYAEVYITDTLFPEFRIPALYTALEAYARRRRTFGGLEAE